MNDVLCVVVERFAPDMRLVEHRPLTGGVSSGVWELLWAIGPSAMEEFTNEYLARVDVDTSDLPIWELFVSAAAATFMGRWGLEPDVEATRRRQSGEFFRDAAHRLIG